MEDKAKTIQTLLNEALAAFKEENFEQAASLFEELIPCLPEQTPKETYCYLYNYLGITYANKGDYEKSIEYLEKIFPLGGENFNTRKNCGISYEKAKLWQKAIDSYKKALLFSPEDKDLFLKIIFLQRQEYQFIEAQALIDKALKLFPNDESFVYKAILNYRDLKKDEKILPFLQIDFSQFSDVDKIKFALSFNLFSLEKFDKAWEFYESRISVDKLKNELIRFNVFPRWDFSDLNNKKILIFIEQGFGDGIHFFRYILTLRKKFPKMLLYFACYNSLIELFKVCYPDINYISYQNKLEVQSLLGEVDYAFSIMSLGNYFKTTPETVPYKKSYLKVKNSLNLKGSGKIKVGICWQGRKDHSNDEQRSIPLKYWQEILQLEEVDFISLQYESKKKELKKYDLKEKINSSFKINNFFDSATIINSLDLVITIDSVTAHLSGAMGKETWVILPYNPDWRWGNFSENSYWYESLFLFRQKKLFGAKEALDEIKKALIKKISH